MENWAWGLALIASTMMVHAIGIVLMTAAARDIRGRLIGKARFRPHHVMAIMIGLVGMMGLLLAVLHGIEATIWAAAYWWLGALESQMDALLYSVDSMSTRGASGLILERHWRMMGALEAVDGMLLFGISTAYVFTMMQDYWSLMTNHHPDL